MGNLPTHIQTKLESKLDSAKRSALATEKANGQRCSPEANPDSHVMYILKFKNGLLCLDVETGWALASKLNKNPSHPGVNRPSPSSAILRV
jgi:hypothetical protein